MNARVLKFRAWDGKRIRYDISHWKISLLEDNDVFNFTQFTGLKDANDVDIYEGDIIEFGTKHKELITVKWGTNCGCCNSVYGFVIDHDHYHHSDGRVIGNIYENEELIK